MRNRLVTVALFGSVFLSLPASAGVPDAAGKSPLLKGQVKAAVDVGARAGDGVMAITPPVHADAGRRIVPPITDPGMVHGTDRDVAGGGWTGSSAQEDMLRKLEDSVRLNASVARIASSSGIDVSAYRVVFPSPFDEGDGKTDPAFEHAKSDIRAALAGGTQRDARRRLATFGDVTTALGAVRLDATDEDRDTLVLTQETRAYVKAINVRAGSDGYAVGTLGQVRTGDRVRFHSEIVDGTPTITFEASSRHLRRVDTFSGGGAEPIQIPMPTSAEARGHLDLAALGIGGTTLGDMGGGATPVVLDAKAGSTAGIDEVVLQDASDPERRTVLVYVVTPHS